MAPPHQWLHATTGRIAPDPHSWMTSVHWMTDHATKGHYKPTAKGSPKWGPTTVAVAQEIAALKECRPGVDYLARKLRVSERTVQYHLGMLRETGLLVYRSKGTRIRGGGNQASVYERTIPVVFDEALGIRTVGEGVQRRPVGASPEHRKTLGKLAKKAARKVRRPRRRTPVSAGTRCTPMGVGTSAASSAASTYSPSESKLASGEGKSPTPKSSKRGPRTLNRVGRRYQLAREAITVIPWLHGASTPRIAWILKDFADNGWTVREVQAVAENIPMPTHGVRRPSGMLADRLRGKADMTATMRAAYVTMWEESRTAAKDRHADYEAAPAGPQSLAARRAMDEAFAAIRDRLAPQMPEVELSPLGSIDDLTRQEVLDLRHEAAKNPDVILDMIQVLGERDARRLYTNRVVDQTLALERINARRDTYAPAF
ncbi:helix-turn-helix domain-containing protein [Streptomyces violaceorubidus]|uniref:helix-turn-helix domain-containing protein n=1 Tax=Streptomyces violaceorubidus TaxID=284042 RepID=UPI0012FF3EE3|nr:helix-turn-helix domain-containing protein [Streptomyces violaceorubidus]